MYQNEKKFKKFFNNVGIIDKICGYFLIMGLAAIIILMTVQIISRYFLQQGFVWTEELARYIFIWITIIGMALALRRFSIVGVKFTIEKLPIRLQKIVRIIGILGVSLFACILIKYGINLISISAQSHAPCPALRAPIHLVYIIFPLGGVLLLIMSIACIIEIILGGEPT